MNNSLDLALDNLEFFEAPLTDMEWGVLAGIALGAGIWIGVAVAT